MITFPSNCSLAFRLAQSHLGVSPLLDVDDLTSGRADSLSVMTYLAQLYHRLTTRRGAVLSLMTANTARPLSWHGAAVTPLERENPFTGEEDLNTITATSTVRLRKYKRGSYSNYSSQSGDRSSSSTPPQQRRRRPSSCIGILPRPYTRKSDQILTSPSLLGQDTRRHFTFN